MWTIEDVNRRSVAEVLEALGHLFEHSPWIVEAALEERPFANVADFHRVLGEVVRQAPPEAQLELIRAHPDLVGRAAMAGSLTSASTQEQQAAGLGADELTPDERETFSQNNAAYRERFGFPFVICARENRKEAILRGFADRLPHDREAEIATALREIDRIAWYRLTDLVRDPA